MIFTVAIDGPAAAGKGTISRAIAARFGFRHLDTGLLYRAVGAKGGDPVAAARGLTEADLARDDLRTLAAGQAASRVAVIPEVRAALLEFQRRLARAEGGAVLDGRDIGTVICPEAEVKLYVTASAEVRAHRRWLEVGGDPAQVLAEVQERDARDMGRADAPLRPAGDATILDTSSLSVEQAIAEATALIGTALARRFGPAEVIFHLPERYVDDWQKPAHLALYPRIAQVLASHGRVPRIVARGKGDTGQGSHGQGTRPGDGNLHLTEGGRVQGPGWLNAALAYLPGFWHLDPQGVLAESSARGDRFDPAKVPAAAARAFADDLRARFVTPRHSRYHQKKRVETLPPGALAVFLQGPAPHRRGHAHMSNEAMLRAVADGAEGRPVLVKPHPLKADMGAALIRDLILAGLPLIQTDANVHDLLAACAATVSINSAAALEGMLHGKPAILFGQSDHADLVETVTRPEDFPTALSRALTRPQDMDAGLWWYFTRHTLDIESPGFEARLLDHLSRFGFPPQRLGL